ncbi:Inosine-5'-monophosphate dehydrogenase [Pseudoalteromonas holothuriae]|uniref:Inosine-5'-monophosphate dehydrogenase n=1 Tax=Pseudoalteromonas holothuriae TaxID=2963714 RepID=A0ABN8UHM4_9GAMM|nr:DUF294 nucleotidyltransferase-like domain-containing protein [Pseudoalteromonas sp. CIP111951]CAH9053331.1 Inosine-5'-monophosphate dehydrogenase [Pseudoalteromonas sp. CIP111951]
MTPEIAEVKQFVVKQMPFSQLPDAASYFFATHLEVIYLTQHNQHQWLRDTQLNLYLVRSGSFDLLCARGEIVMRLAEGDYFGYPSLLTGEAIKSQLRVTAPGLVYVLKAADFDFLRAEYKQFEQYFVKAHTNRLLSVHYKQIRDSWSEKKVSEVMHKGAVTLPPCASIYEAAKTMSEHSVSSVIVSDNNKLLGVVTDKDLRNRVLAKALDPAKPLSCIMTKSPKYIFEHNRVFSALHLMLKHNIHHLPVLNEHLVPLGMLTSTDLLRQQKSDPVQLIAKIHKAQSVAQLKLLASQVPLLLKSFANNIDDMSLLGKLLSSLSDALTSRLIVLYQQRHGPAPCKFSWICFGSQAREEQTLHSDQDNGLLLFDEITDEQKRYFAGMGEFVCAHLAQCGIRTCPGNIMASNEACRGTISQWLTRFETWLHAPTPKAMLNCKIYFDMRFIDGADSLYSEFATKLTKLVKNDLFFAAMASDINTNSVPLGLFQQFKLEKDQQQHKFLDLKRRGVVIINDIVRLYALKARIYKANTQERLEALLDSQQLSKKDIYDLKDCWRFLTQLRLKTQLESEPLPENCINPECLTSLEKHQLKEAFHLIKQAQQACAFKFARGSL